jgi:hypothetical protein
MIEIEIEIEIAITKSFSVACRPIWMSICRAPLHDSFDNAPSAATCHTAHYPASSGGRSTMTC